MKLLTPKSGDSGGVRKVNWQWMQQMSFLNGSSPVETPTTSNFIAIDEEECSQQSLPSSASSTRKPVLPETLELNGSEIKRVEKTKYLGITIDENMNWDEQFKRVRSK